MCLTEVDRLRAPLPADQIVQGWKVFRRRADGLHPEIFNRFEELAFVENVWNVAERYKIPGTNYESGFHFFEYRSHAAKWRCPREHVSNDRHIRWLGMNKTYEDCQRSDLVVRQVALRRVHTWGSQGSIFDPEIYRVGVAGEMMLLPKEQG